jgi:hypothetical protein
MEEHRADEVICAYCGTTIIGVPAQEIIGSAHHAPGPTYRAFCSDDHYEAWLVERGDTA